MKSRASLVLLSLAALASAQTVQLAPAPYKVGDVDAYRITIKMEGVPVEMSMDASRKVVKVYDDGGADVETTFANGHLKGMGMDRDVPDRPAEKARVDKFGAPVGGAAGGGPLMGLGFSQVLKIPRAGMTVGQAVDIDETDPESQSRTKGTLKLVGLKEGVATVVTSLDVTSPAVATPMHLEFTSQIEAATGRPSRVDGRMTGVTGGPGTPTGMTLTMVRKA